MRLRIRRILGQNASLLGAGSGILYTNCLIPLIKLTDGGYGFDTAQSPTGVIDPTHTSNLQLIYSFKFYTDSGDWIMQLGNAGDERSINSDNGILRFDLSGADNILLVWNEANLRYEGNDVATAVIVAGELGNEVCFAGMMVPRILIWYDFAILYAEGLVETTTTTFNRVMNWIKGY